MRQTDRRHLVFLAVSLSLICWTAVYSQNNRSAVSVTGSDMETCTIPDPCRTFDTAISKTNSGGEIVVLSSGGYGPFNVTKSVAIISPGGIHAALAPTTGAAVTINGAGIDVILRNLWINSLGASDGIKVLNAHQVNVENCTIARFSNGINFIPNADCGLSVLDSFVRLNTTYGIYLSSGLGSVSRVTVDRTRLENNNEGILVNPGSSGVVDSMIRESVINSGGYGIDVLETETSHTNVESCAVVHNTGFALFGGGDATRVIRVSQSYIANNAWGLISRNGDDLQSFGNNRLVGNYNGDGVFTSTRALK